MAKVDVLNIEGKVVGDYELEDSIFAIEPNEHAVLQVVKAQLANRRQGTAKTKVRREVSGGGKKPWRQKGTGRARHGSSRSPIWVGGGVTFGPQPRQYKQSVNKKVRRLALKSVFSSKLANKQLYVVDKLEFDQAKTKDFVKLISALSLEGSALFVLGSAQKNVFLSARNIPTVQVIQTNTINVYDILKYDNFVMTKEAADKIQEVYA